MATKRSQTIDFVIPWVDGNDPDWRREFATARHVTNEDASVIRFRDWRNLQYWFRGVEQFAPWVSRIHFITWGHLPPWLNTSNPKLHIVNHADYIPSAYLPTFNSNTIELNIARIEGLAEHFVLFNDDTFLCRSCTPTDFFRRGLPCDMARLSIVQPSSVGHIVYNSLELINAAYRKNEVLRRHFGKWFALRYGFTNLLKSMTLAPWSSFPGILDHHMPQPYLRSQYERAWRTWGEQLDATCRHTFRDLTDLSEWLVRYDTLCRGEFAPQGMSDTSLMTINEAAIDTICRDIRSQQYRMICMNDSTEISDFETLSRRLCEAFNTILPEKSSYEL
ncbi:MAG: Stealth CR1 domain-containing protein [Alistipes sp.]